MISLLYQNAGALPHADEKLTADLLLDTAFSAICPDITKRRVFLAVLTNPLTDADEIRRRADVLHDFTAVPNLLESMRTELDRLTKLHEHAQRERTRAFSIAKSADSESALATARSLLMISADTAKKALDIASQLHTVLRMYMPHASALQQLGERLNVCARLYESPDFSDICRQLADYGYSGELCPEVCFYIGSDGRISGCELTELHMPLSVEKEKSPVLRRLFATKPAAESPDSSIKLADPFGKQKNALLAPAITRCAELLDTLTRDIFDEFTPLSRELCFFEAAAAYVQALQEKHVPLVTPEIADATEIRNLYDLLLCSQRLSAGDVVPNDLRLASGTGVILTGQNNSGKTVYLRAAGCAQLLFQAGLPIPAQSAKMRIFTAVRTGYAAAEKEFASGNEAGRFEQEVREMAALLDSLAPDSLLLMNEIFQSTAYFEGAEGLFHILHYLMKCGTGFILVTHLRELLPMMGNAVVHMQTGENYRVDTAD